MEKHKNNQHKQEQTTAMIYNKNLKKRTQNIHVKKLIDNPDIVAHSCDTKIADSMNWTWVKKWINGLWYH